MASLRPVVCVFLKFPPQEQIFFRIRELSEIFLNKVDQLTMVVAASHSANTSPVAVQAVLGLREAAARHCLELSKAVFNAFKFAAVYLDFVNNLSPPDVSEQTFMDIHCIYIDASLEKEKIEAARKVMVQFKQDVTDVVARIKAALKEGNDRKEVFTAENGQAVIELFQAVDECNSLLRQISEYHADMKVQSADGKEQEIRSCMPSEEEIAMMRERWTNYLTTVKAVNSSFNTVIQKLLSAEDIKKADSSNNNYHQSDESEPPTKASNPADKIDGRNPILGTSASGPSAVEPGVSFWKSFIQHMYSCLTLKYFK